MTYTRPTRAELIAWSDANRRARYAPPVVWCAFTDNDGRSLCSRPATSRDLCHGHRTYSLKMVKAARRAD